MFPEGAQLVFHMQVKVVEQNFFMRKNFTLEGQRGMQNIFLVAGQFAWLLAINEAPASYKTLF